MARAPISKTFVNRVIEQKQINDVIQAWGTRQAMFIRGGGGVGKTSLLRKAYQNMLDEYASPADATLTRKEVTCLGLLLAANHTNRAELLLRGCKKEAEVYQVNLLVGNGENNPEQMAAEFDRLVQAGAQAVLIEKGAGPWLQAAVDRALRAGVKVVAMASQLNGQAIINIQQDDEGLAFRSLSRLFSDLYSGSEIAICWDETMLPVSTGRQKLDDFLKAHPDVRVVAEIQHPHASQTETSALVEEIRAAIRSHPQLRAIWATSANLGLTAAQAIEETHRLDLSLYSIGFDLQVEAAMRQPNSPWKATVAASPAEIGSMMARLGVLAAAGEQIGPAHTAPIKTILPQDLSLAPSSMSVVGDFPGGQRPGAEDESQPRAQLSSHFRRYHDIVRTSQGRCWLLMNFIDLDDLQLQSPEDIELMMVSQFGEEYFRKYLQELEKLRRLEQGHSVQTARLRQVVEELFFECLNLVLSGYRTVIFCDTTDAVNIEQARLVIGFLIRLGNNLNNIALFISGRNTDQLYGEFQNASALVKNQFLDLHPLAYEDTAEYLRRRLSAQAAASAILPTDWTEKVLILSRGLPILIDLSMDWLAQNLELTGLSGASAEQLKHLSPQEMEKYYEEFESSLVRKIREVGRPLDQLILAMARVYPVDTELCASLLNRPVESAANQIKRALAFSFVKSLPGGKIKLHDYMQEMVLMYVWPEMEPRRKILDSQRAVDYYEKQLDKIAAERTTKDIVTAEQLDRAYWQINVQRLEHQWVCNAEKGARLFCNLFDEATRSYRLYHRTLIMEKMRPYLDALPARQFHDVNNRYVRHLIDRGMIPEARERGEESLRKADILPAQRMDLLTKLADAELRAGNLDAAERGFTEALEIGQQNEPLRKWCATILSDLARVKTQRGELDAADRIYKQALDQETIEEDQMAMLLHGMGFVASLQGRYEDAMAFTEESMRIRIRRGDRRGIGATLISMGEIYRNRGDYDQAMSYYNEALKIFAPEGEPVWLARLYAYIGATYRLRGDYESAISILQRSISYQDRLYLPYAYHLLGCVYWDQKRIDDAVQTFLASDELARQISDTRTQVNNLLSLLEIYYNRWIESCKQDEDCLNEILPRLGQLEALVNSSHLFHHLGRTLFLRANLNFERGIYTDETVRLYADAFIRLGTRAAGFGRHTLSDQLNILEKNLLILAEVDPQKAINWCHYLKQAWSNEGIEIAYRTELKMKSDLYRMEIKGLHS